jgi:hypothetical protein
MSSRREKIGEGMKYKAFNLENERVAKVPKNASEVRRSCLRQDPIGTFLIEGGLKNYADRLLSDRQESISRFKSLVEESEDIYHLLGRPEFKEEKIYQDKCQTFGESIREESESYKQIIDDAIELTKECWKHGFADSTFNFTLNYGYNSQDEPILMDFDELVFSKEELLEDIKNKKWENQRIYLWELPLIQVKDVFVNRFSYNDMRGYYASRMDEEITAENLQSLWKSEV